MSRTTCSTCGGSGKTYDSKCNTCRGTGKNKVNKTLSVTIPAGVDTGNQLRLAGKGEAGSNGGPNGDIYLEFNVKEHPLYKREENDIYIDFPITITEAIFGCKKEVPTIHGSVKLTIDSGAETGDKYRLRGKGVEDVHSSRKGDMYVVIKVMIPTKISREQKKLLEELDRTDLANTDEVKLIDKYL